MFLTLVNWSNGWDIFWLWGIHDCSLPTQRGPHRPRVIYGIWTHLHSSGFSSLYKICLLIPVSPSTATTWKLCSVFSSNLWDAKIVFQMGGWLGMSITWTTAFTLPSLGSESWKQIYNYNSLYFQNTRTPPSSWLSCLNKNSSVNVYIHLGDPSRRTRCLHWQ